MAHYREYTDDDVIRLAKEVTSLTALIRAVGLKEAGGNYANMKRLLQKLNVDTSHWIVNRGWSKGKQLKDWSQYTRIAPIRKHLLELRGNMCECCKNTKWMGKPIKLEVHHISGDRTNNDPSNLQLLCPNCHSFTDTWRKH